VRGPISPPEPVRVTQASIPARRQISKTAPALPLILTFSPAAKNAAKAKESVRGLRCARPACAKDGAVKSDHTLQLHQGEGIRPRLAPGLADRCGGFGNPPCFPSP
jgi:hypothetical protein